MNKYIKIISVSLVSILFLVFLIQYLIAQANRPPIFEIHIFNLKSGHPVFIRTANDKRILIDAGSNGEIVRELTRILPFYSKKIDYLILTQQTTKNAVGSIEIINRYEVENIYVPAISLQTLNISTSTDETFSLFLNVASQKGIKVTTLKGGDVIEIDEGLTMRTVMNVFFPTPDFQYSKASAPELVLSLAVKENDHSIAHAFMFLGNISLKIQKFLANLDMNRSESNFDLILSWSNASADNLYFGLLDKINPKYAIFSKSLTAQKTSLNNKKQKADPLSAISTENKINIKEYRELYFVFDGDSLKLERMKLE